MPGHAEDLNVEWPAIESWLPEALTGIDQADVARGCPQVVVWPDELPIRHIGPGRVSLGVKRGFDLLVALAVFLPALAVGLAIAIAIRLSSPGPVFYRQTRVGFRGRPLRVIKFRTMVPDAELRKAELIPLNEADGLFKIRADPRITPVGRFLRRTYLDELPQLLNVLRGQMAVVGPRPLIPDEDRAVKGSGRQRLQVPPGMTGEWQVLRGGGASMDEMIAMDFRYVTEWSLWRDIRCLLRTVAYVCGCRGW